MKKLISMVCILTILVCSVIANVTAAEDSSKTIIFSPDEALNKLKDNTVVRKWNFGDQSSGGSVTQLGFDGKNIKELQSVGNLTKISVNNKPGIKFEISKEKSGSLIKKDLCNNNKKLFVTSLTLNTDGLGKQVIDFELNEAIKISPLSNLDSDYDLTELTYVTPTLTFYKGNIYRGGTREYNDSVATSSKNIIGEYPLNEDFDIDYVWKQPAIGDKAIYVEGIYINGLKIFPTGQEVNNNNAFYDTESGYYTFALIKTFGKTVVSATEVEEKAEYCFRHAGIDHFYMTNSVANSSDYSKGIKSTATFSNISIYGTDRYVYEDESGKEASALSLTSNNYTIIESDANMGGVPTIKGVVNKKAVDFVGELRSPINSTIDIFYADGTTPVDDNTVVEDGMKVCVSDLAKSKTKVYTISNAPDIGNINFSVNEATITSSRSAYKYTSESESFIYVTAVYNSDNSLKRISIDEKLNVTSVGKLDFSANVENVTLASEDYVKVFLWNYDTLTPIADVYRYPKIN